VDGDRDKLGMRRRKRAVESETNRRRTDEEVSIAGRQGKKAYSSRGRREADVRDRTGKRKS